MCKDLCKTTYKTFPSYILVTLHDETYILERNFKSLNSSYSNMQIRAIRWSEATQFLVGSWTFLAEENKTQQLELQAICL